MNGTSQFCRYVGIDYSGAETATSSLRLRVYAATPAESPWKWRRRRVHAVTGAAVPLRSGWLKWSCAMDRVSTPWTWSTCFRRIETDHFHVQWSSLLTGDYNRSSPGRVHTITSTGSDRSLAGFQVTLIGRFSVTAEGHQRISPNHRKLWIAPNMIMYFIMLILKPVSSFWFALVALSNNKWKR